MFVLCQNIIRKKRKQNLAIEATKHLKFLNTFNMGRFNINENIILKLFVGMCWYIIIISLRVTLQRKLLLAEYMSQSNIDT